MTLVILSCLDNEKDRIKTSHLVSFSESTNKIKFHITFTYPQKQFWRKREEGTHIFSQTFRCQGNVSPILSAGFEEGGDLSMCKGRERSSK